ncbi:hypothetical protein MCOR31_011993 [Pyricularia oryzae]|nr:hypothetical protein MCOR31_011993 [Pyricularia oryzae]
MKGCLAMFVNAVDVDDTAGGQECLDDVGVPKISGPMQRRVSIIVPGRDVEALPSLEEKLDLGLTQMGGYV